MPSSPTAATADPVERIRAFNRFYTRRIDLLDEGYLATPFTLLEARLLWELADRGTATAADLARDLGLDPGQLSRILKRFEADALIRRTASVEDARRVEIRLTDHGRTVFAPLEAESRARIGRSIAPLDDEAVGRLTEAMADVTRLVDPERIERPLVLRAHRPGEVATVCARQAAYYARVHRFDERFEALVMEIGAAFLRDFDPRRDASILAEVDGRVVGSIFVTGADRGGVAKLRLLHVESEMRGRGLGRRLVDEAIRFARDRGCSELSLWTNDVLVEARRLYERTGFERVAAEPHQRFGPALVGETWRLGLD